MTSDTGAAGRFFLNSEWVVLAFRVSFGREHSYHFPCVPQNPLICRPIVRVCLDFTTPFFTYAIDPGEMRIGRSFLFRYQIRGRLAGFWMLYGSFYRRASHLDGEIAILPYGFSKNHPQGSLIGYGRIPQHTTLSTHPAIIKCVSLDGSNVDIRY